MINRRIGITVRVDGNIASLPIEFDKNDTMICNCSLGEITIPSGEDLPRHHSKRFQSQIEQLAFKLKELGVSNLAGCFNCKYFARGGMADTASDDGVCLEGREGMELSITDSTTTFSCCDAHSFGHYEDQKAEKQKWENALVARRRHKLKK